MDREYYLTLLRTALDFKEILAINCNLLLKYGLKTNEIASIFEITESEISALLDIEDRKNSSNPNPLYNSILDGPFLQTIREE